MQDRPQPKDQFDNLLEAFGGYGYREAFLLWKGSPKYGTDRLDKVPCRPDNGAVPNIGNSPEAMAQLKLDEAVGCARKLDFDGRKAGVSMFCPKAKLYGVDFDNCVIDGRDGIRLAPWVEDILGREMTYVELSPSGTGIRVILSDVPAAIRPFMTGAERHGIGLYGPATKKHLTLTGNRLEGYSGEHVASDDAMMSRLLGVLAKHAADKGRDVGSIMGRYPPGEKGMEEALEDIRTGTSLHDATVAYIAKAWAGTPEEAILETLVEAYGVSQRKRDAPGVWADRVDDIPGIVEWVRKANGGRPAGASAPLSAEDAARMKEVVERVTAEKHPRPDDDPARPSRSQEPDWTYLLPGQPHDPRPEPLDEAELEVVREAWGRLDEMAASEHDEAWEIVRESRQAQKDQIPLGGVDWRRELENAPEPEWVVDGWIPRGLLTSLFGGDGTGKSYIALSISMRLAVGRPVLGTDTKAPMKVLFLSAEDPMIAIRDRMRRLAEHFRFTDDEWQLLDENLTIPELLTEDVKLMTFDRDGDHKLTPFGKKVVATAEEVDLMILDPISDIYEDEENVRQKVVAFMRQLIVMAATWNIGALLIGHPAKAEDSEYSGSGAWSSKSRSRLFLQQTANGQIIELSQKKTSYGREMQPVLWTWGDRGHPTEVAGDEMRATVRAASQRVIEDVVLDGMQSLALAEQATSGKSGAPNQLPKLMIRDGLDRGYTEAELTRVMRDLIRKGIIANDVRFDGKDGKPKVYQPSNGTFKLGLWFADNSPF